MLNVSALPKARQVAFGFAFVYVIVAAGWILLSDEVLKWLIRNPDVRDTAGMFKGCAFVLATGALLYFAVWRVLRNRERECEQRKRVEESLRQIQERYVMTERAVNDGLWDWNVLTDEDYFSPRWKEIIGYGADEFPNLRSAFLKQIHPDDLEIVKEATRKQLELGERYAPEYRLRHKDGSYRWVFSRGEAQRDASGRAIRLIGAITDITDRKLAEEKLRASEKKFSRMFHASPVAMSVSTVNEGRYLDVNAEWLKMFGSCREEVIGRTALELGVWVDAAQRAEIMSVLKAHGTVRNFELKFRNHAGQVRLLLWSVEATVVGNEDCVLGAALDITERKRAEEQMQLQFSALTAAANAIVITDHKGKIEWVNPSFTRLTGYEAAEAVGNYPRLLKSGQHPPAFYANLWATVLTGNVWHGEIINKRKDGKLFADDTTVTPVRGADGRIAHFVAIKQDVTERRQLENQLRQAQKMEAIGTLAGGIAHDFNNILGAIISFTELAKMDNRGNAEMDDNLDEVLKASQRAAALVRQILSFSRQQKLERRRLQISPVIKEALKLLRATLPTTIAIEQDFAGDLPDVLADPTQIHQVIMNLCTNAAHAMRGRQGKLRVLMEVVNYSSAGPLPHPDLAAGDYVRLIVSDTGHGMDAATLERIFEPFFTTKAPGEGTGLGLSVVHGIVKEHEGVITVESEPGHGTAFTIYLPALPASKNEVAAGGGVIPRGNGERVLFVDDEAVLGDVAHRMLRLQGYQPFVFSSSEAALMAIRENPAGYDIVISDLTMPGMTGLELAKRVSSLRSDLPVILSSGAIGAVTAAELQALGIRELLQKPLNYQKLAAALNKVLRTPAGTN